MRNMFVLIGLFLTTFAFAQSYPKAPNTIRLLTYNTHYCKGGSDPGSVNDTNTRLFARVIQALDPDVVSLQELDSMSNSRGKRVLLDQIATYSGIPFQTVFGGAAAWDGGKIGCGVLVRKSLPIKKIKKIPLDGDEARMVVRVDLEDFIFMGTHLDLNDTKRIMSAGAIVSEVRYASNPSFLAGDLNDSYRWGNGAFANVFNDNFEIASSIEGSSLPGRTDGTQSLIDYVLYKEGRNAEKNNITIVDTQIVRMLEINGSVTDLATISDHYPVFVDIRIGNDASSIKDTEKENLYVYSNPAEKEVYIRSDEPVSQVTVCSVNGETLLNTKDSDIRSIDVSALSAGIYIMNVSIGDRCYQTKLIRK